MDDRKLLQESNLPVTVRQPHGAPNTIAIVCWIKSDDSQTESSPQLRRYLFMLMSLYANVSLC